MNHEILFRGKRDDNGEWIEGYYVPLTGKQFHYILTGELDAHPRVYPEFENFPIDSETVGRYIGLTDKNGKKIFEGDIVQYKEDFYEIKFSCEQARFLALLPNGVFNPAVVQNCEVIGNIHDNPELLGGN